MSSVSPPPPSLAVPITTLPTSASVTPSPSHLVSSSSSPPSSSLRTSASATVTGTGTSIAIITKTKTLSICIYVRQTRDTCTTKCHITTPTQPFTLEDMIVAGDMASLMDKAKQFVSNAVASMEKPEACVTDVDLKGVNLGSVTYLAKVKVTNPYSVSIPIGEIRYILKSFGSEIASGTIPDPGSLKGDEDTMLNIDMKVPHNILVTLVKDIAKDWDIDYELKIILVVDLPLIATYPPTSDNTHHHHHPALSPPSKWTSPPPPPTTTITSMSSVSPPPPITSRTHYYLTNIGLGYAIAIALGFLVLFATLLLASYICLRHRYRYRYQHRHHHQNQNPSDNGIILPSIIFVDENNNNLDDEEQNAVVGLDQTVINSYPKFPFSKGIIDSVCAICLCEYREAEMMRMLPDCKHCFHLTCVDAWLKLNATCPVCRSSPLPTPLSTPLAEGVFASEVRKLLQALAFNKISKLKKEVSISRGIPKFIFLSGIFSIFCVVLFSKLYSFNPFIVRDTKCDYDSNPRVTYRPEIKILETVIKKIEQEIIHIKDSDNDSSHALRYGSFLADIVGLIESAKFAENEVVGLSKCDRNRSNPIHVSPDFFLTEEIRKYVRMKPNRLGKQNFIGANGTFTSIGHTCFSMKQELEEYMNYDVGDICNDDWKLAQRLMVHGCDPLPRRRCFSLAPRYYTKPFPIPKSLWSLPDDKNVRWSQYRCKNFACLASSKIGKGFFKCADCFNLTHHEMSRWVGPISLGPTNSTPDFLIQEVLDLMPGEIRIGLDFSIGTGTFAARMRDQNVTIVSAIINLGAPFSEMIALRGLVPIYVTINQRLPFFDNTLDLIHTTRYKRHKWVVVPKVDKDDDREIKQDENLQNFNKRIIRFSPESQTYEQLEHQVQEV
ncbi:hypothetical protein LXL04_026688 [Taraxacum kok-saghyz]